MRIPRAAAVLIPLLVCTAALAQSPDPHPRLLFNSTEVPGLRAKIHDGIGHDDAAFQEVMFWASLLKAYPGAGFGGSPTTAFTYVPIFAAAHQLTDPADPDRALYGQICRDALLALSAQNPYVFIDVFIESQRLYVLALGFDLCFQGAPEPDRQAIIVEIESWLDAATYWDWHHYENRPYTFNKGLMGSAALGLGAIVLRGDSTQTSLLNDSQSLSNSILAINLNSGMQADGAFNEGVLYAAWSMRFLAPYFEARRRWDGIDYGAQTNVSHLVEWLAYGVRPESQARVESLNDTLAGSFPLALHNTLLDWAQSRYASGIAAWLWEKQAPQMDYGPSRDLLATVLWNDGVVPSNPGTLLPRERVFPNRGLYYYRTGWPDAAEPSSSDSLFTFYSGKYWGGHAQEDQGQFTLFAKGVDFVVDTGLSTSGKHSRGHNVVLIDAAGMPNGGDQHNAGSSIGTDGSLVGWLLSPFADFVHADNEAAYDTHSEFNDPGFPYPGTDWSWGYDGGNPVDRADRYVLSVKRSAVGEYFVLFDDIQKDAAPHTYDWLLHTRKDNCFLPDEGQVTITPGSLDCSTICLTCSQMDVTFVHPAAAELNLTSGLFTVTGPNNDGDTRRLVASTTAVAPAFFVLLYPRGTGEVAPAVTRPPVTGGYAASLTWSGPNVTDQVVFSDGGGEAYLTGLSLHGRSAIARKTNGTLTSYSLSEGSGLYLGSVSAAIVHLGQQASVASDGQRITLSDRTLQYTLFGPSVTQVVDAAGVPVTFQKAGNYVYVNRNPPGGGGGHHEFEN